MWSADTAIPEGQSTTILVDVVSGTPSFDIYLTLTFTTVAVGVTLEGKHGGRSLATGAVAVAVAMAGRQCSMVADPYVHGFR